MNAVAIHESGHAIAAVLLDRPISTVILWRRGGGALHYDRRALRASIGRYDEEEVLADAAVVAYAGPMTERALIPGEGWRDGSSGDMAIVCNMADFLAEDGGDEGKLISDLANRADALVRKPGFLDAAREVGRALEDAGGVLVERQIRRIVEEKMGVRKHEPV